MAILQLEVSRKVLLQAVEQLSPDEFATFVEDVLQVKAQRIAPALTEAEETLLKQIYALQLPDAERSRLLLLGEKLENESLSEAESAELATLIDRSEQLNAERIAVVAKLALVWQRPLSAVMKQLGLWQSYGD